MRMAAIVFRVQYAATGATSALCYKFFLALYDSMVLVWIMTAVSPRVRDLLSVVMVRVTLQEVSPIAIATAVTVAIAKYLIALIRRCF